MPHFGPNRFRLRQSWQVPRFGDYLFLTRKPESAGLAFVSKPGSAGDDQRRDATLSDGFPGSPHALNT